MFTPPSFTLGRTPCHPLYPPHTHTKTNVNPENNSVLMYILVHIKAILYRRKELPGYQNLDGFFHLLGPYYFGYVFDI